MFWLAASHKPHLPGLWDFRSATVGDGLLLPLLLGELAWAAARLGGAGVKQWRWVVGAAVGAAAAGVATQFVWLADPHPRLNWTLPRPGVFNWAGLYHAAFLVLACAALAGSLVAVLVRWRERQRMDARFSVEVFGTSAPILFLTVGFSYVWLLFHDSVGHGITEAALASLAGTVLALIALAVLVRTVIRARMPIADVLLATVGSAGFSVFVLSVHKGVLAHTAIVVFCATTLIFGVFSPMRLSGEGRWQAFTVCGSAMLMGALTLDEGPSHVKLTVLLATAAISLLCLILMWGHAKGPPGLELWIPVVVVIVMAVLAPWIGSGTLSNTATKYVLGLAALLLQYPYIAIETYYLRAASFTPETKDKKPHVPQSAVSLLALGCGAMVAYFSFIISGAKAAGFEAATSVLPWARHPWVMVIVALGACSAALLINTRARFSGSDDKIRLARSASALALLGSISWIAALALTFRPAQGLTSWYVGAAVVAATLLGLLTTESIIVSTAVLQAIKTTRSALSLAAVAGAAVFCSVLWLTLSGIWSGRVAATLPASLTSMAIAYGGGYGVAVLCGLTVAVGCRVPPATEDPPLFNVLQDQLLYCALGSFAIWSAAVAYARAPLQDSPHLLSSFTQVAIFLGPFALLFVFTFRNNWSHMKRQPERIKGVAGNLGRPVDEKAWVRNLRRHMMLQTICAIGLAVVSLAGVAATFLAALTGVYRLLLARSGKPS